MTLQPFKYIAADSLETAEALLRQHRGKAAVMAGGTDLLGALKDAIHPDYPEAFGEPETPARICAMLRPTNRGCASAR